MSKQLPLPLTYADSLELRGMIEDAISAACAHAVAWRHAPPAGPALTHVEQDVTDPATGLTMRVRVPLKRSGKQPAHVDGPRYAPEAIDAELAMILYRAAVRLGLHATGTEAALLAEIARLEALVPGTPRADVAAALAEGTRA